MSILFAVLVGIIQGLTEFLPVSSSGHLAIFQNIFGMQNAESDFFAFDVLLHMATLAAVLIFYGRDVFSMIPAFFTGAKKLVCGKFKIDRPDESERLAFFVAIGTLPLVAAFFFRDAVEGMSKNTRFVGAALILNAIVLFVCDRARSGERQISDMKPRHALAIGFAQALAVIPGLSRSGSTISCGRLCGLERESAVKFSFLLSLPAILGANVANIPELAREAVPRADIPAYICGMIAAAVTGILAMKLLTYISRKSDYRIFSVYCAAAGALTIIFG